MGERKKQVVVCTDGIFPHAVGGMQRHSRLLVEHLAAYSGWDIIVIHPHKEKIFTGFSKVVEETIEPIDTQKNYLRECYGYSKRVYQVLQKYPQAVIYSQGLSVWYQASELHHRLIVNPHGLEPYQAMGFKDKLVALPFKRVFGKLFRKASRVVSLGGNLTGIIARIIPREKIAVLPNGVLPRPVQKRDFERSSSKMLFVARFAHNKGIHILLDAVDQLNREGYADTFEFHLVGKGPLYDHYTSNNKSRNIIMHGFVKDEDLEKMYADGDAMVFPTLFEGMPTVILEAMANGMPVIASDTGAIAELVDKSNGWLIKRGSIEELKNALKAYARLDHQAKAGMSKASLEKVAQHFLWEKVAAAHVRLFEELLDADK